MFPCNTILFLTTLLCIYSIFYTVIDTQPPAFEGPTRKVVFAHERSTAAEVDYSWEPVKVFAFNENNVYKDLSPIW